MTCTLHRWTPWQPVNGGLLERRCACGAVERGSYEAINAGELDRLTNVMDAFRRVFRDE